MQPGRLAKGMVAIRRRLACLGVEEVVITRGGESTLCLTSASALEAPVLPVEPIDTVGAGDTFAGTLAVRLAEGESLECAGGPPTAPAPWPRSAAIPSRSATDRMLARLPATPRL
jgi:ribokinase